MIDYPIGMKRRPSGLWVPKRTKKYDRPVGIDLFAGIGGLSLGFIEAGFRVICGCDNEIYAALSYMHNLGTHPIQIHFVEKADEQRMEAYLKKHLIEKKGNISTIAYTSGGGWKRANPELPGVPHFWFGDLRKLTGQQLLEPLGLDVGEVDCVFGGPPCQGFSLAGKRNVMDPRNSLVIDFARLCVEIHPKTLCMENVPGILSMVTPEGLPVIDAICRILEDGAMGTFEALKKSLTASSSAGAVLRTNPKAQPSDFIPKKGKSPKKADPQKFQKELF